MRVLNESSRYRKITPNVSPSHKFALGSVVAFRTPAGERSLFRVNRHLPDSGQGLQYRIQSEQSGRERVTVESALLLDSRPSLFSSTELENQRG
jgi:hypothetical protein